ncbi:MAG: MFS transporter [Candidatus Sulfotelmatobacter sp.]
MPATDASLPYNSARPLTYVGYICFLPIGIATVLLGPILPTLSARWSLNYAQAGALFNAQYFAATCAVACSGALAARWGFRFPIKIGLLLMTIGLSFLLSGSKLVGILCIVCYGGGLGLAVPAANLLVAAANPERRSAALNLLNFFWSMGAVSCPFLVAAAAKSNHLPAFLISVAGFSLATAIGIALMPTRVIEPATIRDAKPMLPLIRSKIGAFSILALLFLLYVGVENSFGQWMASYAKSLGTLPLAMSLATPSFFYASLMLGRWLAPLILRVIEDTKLVQAGSLLACGGMVGLIFSHDLIGIAASACAAGLGLSSVYPITISFLSRQFESGGIGSLMFTLSNIGGGLLPWIVGLSSNRFGTLKAGLLVPVLGCAAMRALFLSGSLRHSAPPPPQPNPSAI